MRGRTFLIDRGGALFLVVLVTYLWIAPSVVVDGENAHFSTLGAVGGRAHPSGYPAYVLYLRLTSWLPGATPAHTAALATAILGAVSVLVLHAACRAWGARPLAATFAAGIYAAAPVVLRTHTAAEVFAMNALVVATVLWLAAAGGPLRGTRRVAVLGLVAGIGLANHMTCSLAAPVGVLGAIRGVREAHSKVGAAAAGIGGLALGLSLYLYMMITDSPASWGYAGTLGDLRALVLRETYGGPGAFLAQGEVPLAGQLWLFATTVGRAWLFGGALLGIAMLGIRAIRPGDGEPRWGWRMLAVSFVLAGPLLVTRFNIELVDLGVYVCQRFHLLPILLLAIPVAVGIDRLGTHLWARAQTDRLQRAATPLACVLFVALTVIALPRLRAQHSPALEHGIEHMLASVPEHSIVVGSADDLCFTMEYLQHARKLRPDVTFVCWLLTSHDWYWTRIVAQGLFLGRFNLEMPRGQAELWQLAGRPLFVEQSTDQRLGDLPRYPYGILVRVLPRGARQPSALEILEENRALFGKLEPKYAKPGPDDDWATIMFDRYARTWRGIARRLDAAGDPARAEAAADIARAYAPTD